MQLHYMCLKNIANLNQKLQKGVILNKKKRYYKKNKWEGGDMKRGIVTLLLCLKGFN